MLLFTLYAVTVWSITRLVAVDAFPPIAAARGWITDRTGDTISYLVVCLWCLSFWVAVATWAALTYGFDYSMPAPVLWIFAARVVAGFGDTIESALDAYTRRNAGDV